MKISNVVVRDVRFPTSQAQDGSDSLNLGDYSAACVVLETDAAGPDSAGHGLTFTNGRGNEIVVAAIHALKHHVLGRELDEIVADMRAFYRDLTVDAQLRWLGPEKGILHMATGALLNAVWDLWAKREAKPVWKHLVDLTPETLVSTIEFSYITDVLTPEEAIDLLHASRDGLDAREAEMRADGYPAYTTSTGWLGYPDDKVRRLCKEAVAAGWTAFKMKVGLNLDDNLRRAAIMREEIGPDCKLMMDANQCWDVDESIAQMTALARFDPWWIEEPTSPDDVLGHARIAREIAPIAVATGEVCQNRVMFKQFLQADALKYVQVDACRMGGLNEALAVILMAKQFGRPVCPHAGGVGLCEYVQHLSIFDYVAVSGSLTDRLCEYVDHLHEHFVHPCVVEKARYVAPLNPGFSVELEPASVAEYEYPDGPAWRREDSP